MRVLFGALVLVAALLLSPGLAVGPSLDAAVFAGIGEQLLVGDRLYLEAWDHKPPGAYVVSAIGQAVLPWLSPWAVSWLISVLATAGTGLGLAMALASLGVRQWAASIAAGLAVAFMAQYLTALGGGLTEPLAALPASWALVFALSKSQRSWRRLGIGLLLGFALLTSLQLAPALIAIASLAVTTVDSRHRLRGIVDLVVGAAVPWLVGGLVFLAVGSLGAAIDAVFAYGAAYRTASSAFGAELSRAPAAWTLLSALALITGAAMGGLTMWRTSGRQRWVLYVMAGWVVLALALFAAQGRFIAHYAIPLAIPLTVLAGVGLEAMVGRWRRSTPTARTVLLLPLVAALLGSVTAGLLGGKYELAANQGRSQRVATAAQFVSEHTEPADEILVWGNRPELYLAAARMPATPYRFMYPMTTDGYVTANLIAQVRSDLSADPPRLVVDAGSDEPGGPGFLPLLIDRPVVREGREVDMLGPLREYIAANYELLTVRGGWPIYQLRTLGTARALSH